MPETSELQAVVDMLSRVERKVDVTLRILLEGLPKGSSKFSYTHMRGAFSLCPICGYRKSETVGKLEVPTCNC